MNQGDSSIEGMACGLPVLYYKNSGELKKLLKIGLKLNNFDDLSKLKLLIENYDNYRNNIDYHFLSNIRFGNDYFNLIENL